MGNKTGPHYGSNLHPWYQILDCGYDHHTILSSLKAHLHERPSPSESVAR